MSTLKTTTIQDTSGSNSSTTEQIAQGRAKAWGNFNGSGTPSLANGFNIAAVTDTSNSSTFGDYTITFTNSMPNTNYCVVFGGGNNNGSGEGSWNTIQDPTNMRTTGFDTRSFNSSGNNQNQELLMFAVFGD